MVIWRLTTWRPLTWSSLVAVVFFELRSGIQVNWMLLLLMLVVAMAAMLENKLAAWPVDTNPLQCISPALLKSLAFAMHRKNLASERSLGALQGLVLARAELQASLVHWAGLLYGQVQLQVRP